MSSEPVNYEGDEPSVECAYPPCRNRLRFSEYGAQWCSKEHRTLSLAATEGQRANEPSGCQAENTLAEALQAAVGVLSALPKAAQSKRRLSVLVQCRIALASLRESSEPVPGSPTLREALEQIAYFEESYPVDPSDLVDDFQGIARAALAAAGGGSGEPTGKTSDA